MRGKVSLIAALSKNRVIGRQNRLPWHLPEDLKRFKELTTGHPVIMGRKTYESIGKILPNRRNVIVSRQRVYEVAGGIVVDSLDQAFEVAGEGVGSDEIFVIGGAEIYQQAIPFADRLYLTMVDVEAEGDAFFPEWDERQFKEISREDRKGPTCFSFRVLERR